MKFRPQRGSLDKAMAECVELPQTKCALAEHLNAACNFGPRVIPEEIETKPYGYDDRIDWHTHIVTTKSWGVLGFTDSEPI